MLGRAAFFSSCVVAIAGACASFEPNDAVGSADAGDGGSDGDAGHCRVLVDDSFDDGGLASWARLGKARYVDGEVELVPDEPGATGAIWMNVADPSDGVLHVKFVSKISPPEGDDGLTFAWASNQDITLGGTGANYGVCGGGANASGLAVAISGNGDRLRLLDLTKDCAPEPDIPENPFGTNVVEVTARAKTVDVVFAGRSHSFTAPAQVRPAAIGFTAATGGGHARHAIDSVHVEICSE